MSDEVTIPNRAAHYLMYKMIKDRDAEIERLASAHANRAELVVRLQDRIDNAAAFLDGLAETLDDMIGQGRRTPAGDDCRVMAKKLRGEI